MNGFNHPPPGPDEPPPPYMESERQFTAPPQSYPRPSQDGSQDSISPPLSQQSSTNYTTSSRPSRGSNRYTHSINIRANSLRSEHPYPGDWAPAHDVGIQDWSVFIAHLIPDDAVVADAKGLTPGRLREVEATIQEWNNGFFLPRGVRIHLMNNPVQHVSSQAASASHGSSSLHTVPSSSSAYPPGVASSSASASTSRMYREPSQSASHMSSRHRWTKKLKDMASDRGVDVSSEAIRAGDKFSLSAGGLKIGSFELDRSGMNYGGRPIGPGIVPSRHDTYQQQGLYGQQQSSQGYRYGGHGGSSYYETPRYGAPSQQYSPRTSYDMHQSYAPPPGPPPRHVQQQTGTL